MRITVVFQTNTRAVQFASSVGHLYWPQRQYTRKRAMLMKASSQSLTDQLAARFPQRIRDRRLAPGARLPSVRQCAQQHEVSPSTVVAAYDQLLAQGLVEARKNRGFFVRESRAEPPPASPGSAAREQVVSAWTTATGFAGTRSYVPINATA